MIRLEGKISTKILIQIFTKPKIPFIEVIKTKTKYHLSLPDYFSVDSFI
jgi:hypothetical protein